MSALTQLARLGPRDESENLESLEQLVLACLDGLATLARERGQRERAARLMDALEILRDEHRPAQTAELSPREWEVAALVARGHSNRQIAQSLVLSERTIDTHVSNILRKLSLVSRAQIAAWFVSHSRQVRAVG